MPEPEYVTNGHEVRIVFMKKHKSNSDENENVNVGSSVGSLSVVKRTIERDLADLQKKGILCREGNTSAGRWVLLRESE